MRSAWLSFCVCGLLFSLGAEVQRASLLRGDDGDASGCRMMACAGQLIPELLARWLVQASHCKDDWRGNAPTVPRQVLCADGSQSFDYGV
ncbi:MAG: hypothetical protein CME86_04305 [Herbaspirillum sp.]|nr:hypothetical protein [Herbaspirillum sp.]MBO15856.1 hypothetical protein [Herbaspirillum sp.]